MSCERLHSGEPEHPTPLPAELAIFLRTQECTGLLHGSDQGTAMVIKAPAVEIASVRGRVPVGVRHALYTPPTAPVIQTVVSIYDQPDRPLVLETFTNIAASDQREDFARLADQEQLLLLFYDERLAHRLTKAVPYRDQRMVLLVLSAAERWRRRIPAGGYDFDRAKQAVMKGRARER